MLIVQVHTASSRGRVHVFTWPSQASYVLLQGRPRCNHSKVRSHIPRPGAAREYRMLNAYSSDIDSPNADKDQKCSSLRLATLYPIGCISVSALLVKRLLRLARWGSLIHRQYTVVASGKPRLPVKVGV